MELFSLIFFVFFDLKKAFDRVCLPGLVLKLKAAGLQGKALAWCTSFLTGRRQHVRVGSAISSAEHLHAGVPQGAILSPLFFSIYINDIVKSADAEFNLFADDTSVYITAKSAATLQERLQGVLDKVTCWLRQWGISINPTKSALMVFTRKRDLPLLDIKLDGNVLAQASTHKHLGLVLNRKLTWSDHINFIRGKAAKKLGLLRRIRRRLPPLVVRTLYVTCVRPTLEYASGAWGGLGKEDANRLEHLQRCAARTIAKVSLADKMPNELLLARAGLEPLSVRRLVAVATPTYLMLHDPIKAPLTCRLRSTHGWLQHLPHPVE